MGDAQVFGLLSALLLLAFGANRLFRITRVPDLVVLLVTGLILGPGLRWVNPDQFRSFTQMLGSLAIILILLEGGMELNLHKGISHFPGGVILAFVGYGLSFWAVAAMAHYSLALSWHHSLLLGGVFGPTSSTVVMPVLQQLQAREPVQVTLLLESALGDVIGVLCVTTLLNTSGDNLAIGGFVSGFLLHAGIAAGIGAAAGLGWWWIWPRLADMKFSIALAFSAVLGTYSLTHAAGGSGLLAVLAFGLMLGNLPNRGQHTIQEDEFLNFHSELSFLVRSFFFVLLGVIVQSVDGRYVWPVLGILAAMVLARYVAVQVSRLALRGVTKEERELIFLVMPRGLITAVLSVQIVEAKGAEFDFLPAMAFAAIVATNLLLVVASIRIKRKEQPVTEEPVTAIAAGAN